MNNKRIVLTGLLLAQMLSACGNNNTENPQPDPEPTPEISLPTLHIAAVQAQESATQTTQLIFNVILSQATDVDVSFSYHTQSGTATESIDYASTSGVLTVPAGQTNANIAIDVFSDTDIENNETLSLVLSDPVNATLANTIATGTIIDSDMVTVNIADSTVPEGNSGTSDMLFSVTLSKAASSDITIHYDVLSDTAKSGTDFDFGSSSLVIPAGDISANIVVLIHGDTEPEADENFSVALTSADSAIIGRGTATGTIENDDLSIPPTLHVSAAQTQELPSQTTQLIFNVVLSQAADVDVSVSYHTQSGTATETEDYASTSGILTLPAGQTSANIAIEVFNDAETENTETLSLVLSNAVNATLATTIVTGTIIDSDVVTVSIADSRLPEGNSGTSDMVFAVTLNKAASSDITINYNVLSDTAKSGTDFTFANSSLVVPAGDTSANIAVSIRGDTTPEVDEIFSIKLTSVDSAIIGRGTAIGTIENDDLSSSPIVSIGNSSVVEGDQGTVSMVFTVELSYAIEEAVTVDYYTYIDVYGETAMPVIDFYHSSGTATILPGTTSAQFFVSVVGDTRVEDDETFLVYLQNVSANAILPAGTYGQGVISTDDYEMSIITDRVSVIEGDMGSVEAIFEVGLNGTAVNDVFVDYTTKDGTATAGSDYIAETATLTIPAGSDRGSISITVLGDTVGESNESFSVELTNPIGAEFNSIDAILGRMILRGTIDNDDPVLQIRSARLTEGNTGTTNMAFSVWLTNGPDTEVSVNYNTQSGTAVAGEDFEAATGTITFAPNEWIKDILIPIFGDTDNEPDETFTVSISTDSSVDIITDTNTATIVDDDRPTITISPGTSVVEGDSGTSDLVFNMSLSHTTSVNVTYEYLTTSTSDTPATASVDYTPVSGTGTIPAGSTSSTIVVPVLGDLEVEPDEKVQIKLDNVVGADTGSATGWLFGTGTIFNDDNPQVSIDDISVFEGTFGNTVIKVPVHVSKAISSPITVSYQTSDGTAIAGEDYIAVAGGQLTIPANTSTAMLNINLMGDQLVESDETLALNLTGAVNASLGVATATIVIENDDRDNPVYLPSSGQTSCTGDCADSGQDGEYQAGAPWTTDRFVSNTDGSIKDTFTGLVWSADTNAMPARNPGWDTDGDDDGLVSWQHALDYVAKLNAELFLGFNDWRLPNRNELRSLVNYGAALNWLSTQGFLNSGSSGAHWSSTSNSTIPEQAWRINLTVGDSVASVKTDFQALVVPVRGQTEGTTALFKTGQTQCYDDAGNGIDCLGSGQDGEYQEGIAWPVDRFTVRPDGTILDQMTGLVWMADANLVISRDPDLTSSSGDMEWQEALDYIAKLNAEAYLGHTDWRLPNVIELQSLTNSQVNTINWLNGYGFYNIGDVLLPVNYWTSTNYSAISDVAWFFNFGNSYATATNAGTVQSAFKTMSLIYVWPVRGGAL